MTLGPLPLCPAARLGLAAGRRRRPLSAAVGSCWSGSPTHTAYEACKEYVVAPDTPGRQTQETLSNLLQENRRFEPPAELAARRTSRPTPTRRRRPTGWRSGSGRPSGWTGRSAGTPCSSGTRRSPSGSSAASSTLPTTASTATSRRARRQGRLPLGGRARGRQPDDHLRRPAARGGQGGERADRSSACARATGSPSTCR